MAIVSKSVSQNHVISGIYHFEARGKKGLTPFLEAEVMPLDFLPSSGQRALRSRRAPITSQGCRLTPRPQGWWRRDRTEERRLSCSRSDRGGRPCVRAGF